ncbi:MAG: 3-phosphoshikimate 1-carboxyvinyltransferase [Coriobacteriia bacterium]|nr:3-phosphoshikimate 1-carboxyvinyltransferase [Coriobacteriia bacterium]
MKRTFGGGCPSLVGEVHVPGDKSLSHRAVLFSAMAEGTTELTGVLDSEDVQATIHAVRALGAHVELSPVEDGSLAGSIRGWGVRGPRCPHSPIDCGNSGTTARLLLGVLAGWPVEVALTGDESLSRRPMRRVTDPLESMGVRIATSESGTLPITVLPTAVVEPLVFVSPVASAQVKTAVLLAGLRAHGVTSVEEPALSRDHTERMLPAFGVGVGVDASRCRASVTGPATLTSPGSFAVPRDPSSAAFLVAAGLMVPGSDLRLPGVSLNETRTGFLAVLERMGAQVRVVPFPEAGNERVGEIEVRFSPSMQPTTVTAAEIPSLVDEIPILALVASQIEGETRFESVGELRVKESDRFEAIVGGLTALGAHARAEGETLVVRGPAALQGATLDSLGDHRLAMTWAVAGLVAAQPVSIDTFEAVSVSYPGFETDLLGLQARAD